MRLIKSSGDRRVPVGPEALRQLRDLGGRLEHSIARYGRLVRDAADATAPASELRDGIETMNGQLAYVVRRLQELIVADYEARHAPDASDAEAPGRVAVG